MDSLSSKLTNETQQNPNHSHTVPINPLHFQILINAQHFVSLKLDFSNYKLWCSQVRPFLKGLGLLGYIEGGARDIESEDELDEIIKSLLISSLTSDVLPLVTHCRTAKGIWEKLAEGLDSPTSEDVNVLRFQLAIRRLKQGDTETVSDYLNRSKSYEEKLKELGSPPTRTLFNLFVLRGLRPDFNHLVPSLMLREQAISDKELFTILVKHECINLMENPMTADSTTILFSPTPTSAAAAEKREKGPLQAFVDKEIALFESLRGHLVMVAGLFGTLTYTMGTALQSAETKWHSDEHKKKIFESLIFSVTLCYYLSLNMILTLVFSLFVLTKTCYFVCKASFCVTMYYMANGFLALQLLYSPDDDRSQFHDRINFIHWLVFFIAYFSSATTEILIAPWLFKHLSSRNKKV